MTYLVWFIAAATYISSCHRWYSIGYRKGLKDGLTGRIVELGRTRPVNPPPPSPSNMWGGGD